MRSAAAVRGCWRLAGKLDSLSWHLAWPVLQWPLWWSARSTGAIEQRARCTPGAPAVNYPVSTLLMTHCKPRGRCRGPERAGRRFSTRHWSAHLGSVSYRRCSLHSLQFSVQLWPTDFGTTVPYFDRQRTSDVDGGRVTGAGSCFDVVCAAVGRP